MSLGVAYLDLLTRERTEYAATTTAGRSALIREMRLARYGAALSSIALWASRGRLQSPLGIVAAVAYTLVVSFLDPNHFLFVLLAAPGLAS